MKYEAIELHSWCYPRVRVRTTKKPKKNMASPARVAERGQENIETVHEPKPIQTVSTLCDGQGRRAMESSYGP
jgi:hypothetical protein